MSMTLYKFLLLPGDGIGPEVMAEVSRLVGWVNARGLAQHRDRDRPRRRLRL